MGNFSPIWTAQTLGPALKAVKLASTAALPACTPAGAGVGKTLTMDAVGVLALGGGTVLLNDRVGIKDQAAADDNGIYACTTEGTGAVAAVLTRATDFDQAAANEVANGEGFLVSQGTLAGTSWILNQPAAITVDTTDLPFVQGGGDDDVVTSQAISALENPTLGLMITVTEVQAPLVGYIEVQHTNARAKQGTGQPEDSAIWRPYAGLAVVGGAAITDGQLDVAGSTTFDVDILDFPFGWLRLKWVGDTGTALVTANVTAKKT